LLPKAAIDPLRICRNLPRAHMDLLKQTWANLTANKLRSFLTMFGIAWGLICLILMTAMGEGLWVAQKQRTRSLGKNILIVWGGTTSKRSGGIRAGKYLPLTLDDFFLIREKASLVESSSPEMQRSMRVRTRINDGIYSINGVYPGYMQIRTMEVESSGRLINDGDNLQARRVCILGNITKDRLFGREPAIGSTITIGDLPYLVIAVLIEREMDSGYNGRDATKIFIPYHAMEKDFPLPWAQYGKRQVSNIILQARSEEVAEAAELQVRQIMAKERGFDPEDRSALGIWNTVKEAQLLHNLFATLKLFLGAMAIVTLALGGVGVMNIMLLSVGERTREIGICKAVGATTRRILLQFFAESLTLVFIAGITGIMLGWGLCALLNLLPRMEFFAGMIVTPQIAGIAAGFLTLVGVLSSIYPAFMASTVDPIEALRCE